MIITKKALPRRTFLRGAGAALALPLLDAMVPSMTALTTTLRIQFAAWGLSTSQWGRTFPSGRRQEKGRAPPNSLPSLQSLTPVIDRLTVITNLELKNAYPGTHATSNAAFLSAAKSEVDQESTDYYLGTTVDQVAASVLGSRRFAFAVTRTRNGSLDHRWGQCDNGYACVYQNNLSWSSPTTPLPPEAHPRVAFERLFGDGGSAADREAELRKSSSLLDWVRSDISRLQRKLSPSDRTKVDHYLESVREVERRIQKAEAETADSHLPDLDRPVGVPPAYADHARLMFDLQVLALQADVARVITFQLARETSTRTYLG